MTLIDATADIAGKLHRAPFGVRHRLADHPLFALPRLVALAQSMPGDRVEYNSGKLAPGTKPEDVPRLDMPASEVIRRIEHHNAWLVIKGVEADPDYRAVLEEFLAGIAAAAGGGEGQFRDLKGFLFVSSADATTPFHVDAEENILVQIRGDKFVHVFDNADRTLVSEEALEISPAKHRNQAYRPEFEARAEVFALKPGDGVHIPYLWPHWVRTGATWSVSMAMTWKTPEVERLNKVRLMNGTLRRFGLVQRAPGEKVMLDAAKVIVHDGARMLIEPLRRSEGIRRVLRGLVYGRGANYYYEGTDKASA
jgi:hypothetical protein